MFPDAPTALAVRAFELKRLDGSSRFPFVLTSPADRLAGQMRAVVFCLFAAFEGDDFSHFL
jgi:hypothetical protein